MSTSDAEDDAACKVCQDFEPQAWRKSLCRNCFHSLDEHSEDLLAAEAEAFAKEKGINRDVDPAKVHSPKCKMLLQAKGKLGEAGNTKSLPNMGKGRAPVPSPKSTPSSPAASSLKSSQKSTSSTPTSSTSPKTASTTSDPSSKSAPVSKAKNVASKFEAKTQDKSALGSKLDQKSKSTDNLSKSFPKEQNKVKEDSSEKKDGVKSPSDSKDKKVPPKVGDKDTKISSKAAPFGKDMLKSSKDVQKKDTKSNDTSTEKSKTKDPKAVPSNDKSVDAVGQKSVNDKDKLALYKDRGKDKGGGGSSTSSPATSAPATPVLSPSTSASPILSPTSTSPSPTLLSPTSKQPPNDKRPKDLRLAADKTSSVLGKFKELEKKAAVKDDSPKPTTKSKVPSSDTPSSDGDEKLKKALSEKEEKVKALEKQVSKMETDMKKLEAEKLRIQKEERKAQKDEMEKMLQELRGQLDKMSGQCERLQTDNQSLINKLHVQEDGVKRNQAEKGKNSDNVVLEEDLEMAEKELEECKEENKDLQSQIMEMKNEMDEMYDNFRENEHDEFRELQKELDMTAKNCRILQFKLRKAERRNEQIEEDRIHYEDKLRLLQDQFDSQDAKNHIRVLEEELRVAKEVSVRLHDELDIVEDKRGKALEENRHLTELLEHTDKRQFRLEMEIDKLRDLVSDLKMQLKEAKGSNNNKESSPDRKVPSYIYSRSIMD